MLMVFTDSKSCAFDRFFVCVENINKPDSKFYTLGKKNLWVTLLGTLLDLARPCSTLLDLA
jgi:hypothetical protein